jgi:hypothetical protein
MAQALEMGGEVPDRQILRAWHRLGTRSNGELREEAVPRELTAHHAQTLELIAQRAEDRIVSRGCSLEDGLLEIRELLHCDLGSTHDAHDGNIVCRPEHPLLGHTAAYWRVGGDG